VVLALGPGAAVAAADGAPSDKELLEKCEEAQACKFHEKSFRSFVGVQRQVGNTAFNCSAKGGMHAIAWSDTRGGSDNFQLRIRAGLKLFDLVETQVETVDGRTWDWSHTATETSTVQLAPWSTGWVERAPRMKEVTGRYELEFKDKLHDHYKWFVDDVRLSSPEGSGAVFLRQRPMTPQERARC
jgi:hypothetical protein